MTGLTWFALGSIVGAAVVAWFRSRNQVEVREVTTSETPTPPPPATVDENEPVTSLAEVETKPDRIDDKLAKLDRAFASFVVAESESPLHAIATGIGRELADLATAVQGNAQLLCEVASEPEQVAKRCEFLWAGVDRLRLLTEKILTFARDSHLQREQVDVRSLLDDVRREVETAHGDLLAVQVATSSFLPPAVAHRSALSNAILFLIDTLLELEPSTHSIMMAAYADETDEGTTIGVEICAESEAGGERARPKKHALELGYLAAQRSLEAQGAQLWFHQVEDLTSTCFITLEADLSADFEPVASDASPHDHEFGGVLVLEDNPSIRNMIATELERLGRKMFSCVDAASARALLGATPERFELLILERDARHGDGLAVARDTIASRPDTKALILGELEPEDEGDFTTLSKPFSLLELRAALVATLAPDHESDYAARNVPPTRET